MKRILLSSLLILGFVGCSTYDPMDDFELKTPTTYHDIPVVQSAYPREQVMHGKYLTELLACATCHTDGALVGKPRATHQMAGSRVGIAFSNPFVQAKPGVLYPSNITPDRETGIGTWTDDDIVRVIRTGVDAEGARHLPVMPWPAYAKITDEDARAIVAFLRSLPPVRHQVPSNASPGQTAPAPFVHFGVYQSKRQ